MSDGMEEVIQILKRLPLPTPAPQHQQEKRPYLPRQDLLQGSQMGRQPSSPLPPKHGLTQHSDVVLNKHLLCDGHRSVLMRCYDISHIINTRAWVKTRTPDKCLLTGSGVREGLP